MRMPSASQRKLLERAVTRYQGELDRAKLYLGRRGITRAMAEEARLGVVYSAEVGHENAVGRLCIPYTNKAGVMGVKFRCLRDHDCKTEGCPKYTYPLGQESYLYGILDTESDAETIHVTEGELDRLILKSVLNEPTVGVPGVQNWKAHYPFHFRGFERVLVWPDGDKAGADFAHRVRKEISAAEVVPMPQGFDVNKLFLELGAEAIRKLAGADDENEESTHG